MTRKGRRLALIGTAAATLTLAAGLVLTALKDTIVFFYGPTEIAAKAAEHRGARLRLGGLVKEGSVARLPDGLVRFEVTDRANAVPVRYRGLLPDLFREGQGVVAEGVLEPSGEFRADSILAKHDETYMPKEVADALKKGGVWQGDAKEAKPAAGAESAAAPGSIAR